MPRAKEEILFEWTRPKRLNKEEAYKMIKEGKISVPRIIIITALLEIICYFALARLSPIESGIDLHKYFYLFMKLFIGVIIIVPIMYFLFPWTEISAPPQYRITSDGIILRTLQQRRVLKWGSIIGYLLKEHPVHSEFNSIVLWNEKMSMTLWLPEDNRAQEIIDLVSSNISYSGDLPENFIKIKLKKWELAYFSALTIAYSMAFAGVSFFGFNEILELIFYFTFFFGPGTLGLIFLYGKRAFKNKNLVIQVIPFNFIAVLLILVTTILIKYFYFV